MQLNTKIPLERVNVSGGSIRARVVRVSRCNLNFLLIVIDKSGKRVYIEAASKEVMISRDLTQALLIETQRRELPKSTSELLTLIEQRLNTIPFEITRLDERTLRIEI